jgi:hypothetical protein
MKLQTTFCKKSYTQSTIVRRFVHKFARVECPIRGQAKVVSFRNSSKTKYFKLLAPTPGALYKFLPSNALRPSVDQRSQDKDIIAPREMRIFWLILIGTLASGQNGIREVKRLFLSDNGLKYVAAVENTRILSQHRQGRIFIRTPH